MAAALGEVADEKHYKTLLPKLKSEWHRSFWNPEISAYSTGTQMAQAAAIWLDDVGDGHIVPSADMHGLVQRLGDDCKSRGVTIGFVGVRYMFEALAKQNGTDAALACISRPGYPGFHYEIYNEYEPSSALWESWNVNTQKCITCETSRDHHYRAAINTFLRKYVAGLDMPPGEHGWSVIKVRPEAAYSNLNSASATIETHRGMVHTSWERDTHSGVLTLELTVRSNTDHIDTSITHALSNENCRATHAPYIIQLYARAALSRCRGEPRVRCTSLCSMARTRLLQKMIRFCGANTTGLSTQATALYTQETMGASYALTRFLDATFSKSQWPSCERQALSCRSAR